MAKKNQSGKGHTVQELAQRFQISEASVRNFVGQLKPSGKRGRSKLYDWKEVEEVKGSRRSKARNGEVGKLDQEKARLQIRKLQMDVEVQEGKLLPIEEVKREFLKFCKFVNVHLGRMGRDLGVELEGKNAIQIEKAIDKHNEKLSEKLAEQPY